jgi:hypothetical protein
MAQAWMSRILNPEPAQRWRTPSTRWPLAQRRRCLECAGDNAGHDADLVGRARHLSRGDSLEAQTAGERCRGDRLGKRDRGRSLTAAQQINGLFT